MKFVDELQSRLKFVTISDDKYHSEFSVEGCQIETFDVDACSYVI